MTIFLDQEDDAGDTGGVYVCEVAPCLNENGTGNNRSGRGQLEMKQITAISGNVVTISPGLYNTNWRAAQNPGAWWVGPMLTGVGIENLTVNHNGSASVNSGIYFLNCHNCWVKNVRSLYANRNHVWCFTSSNITVRDSYFYGTLNNAEKSYGFEGYGCADALIENNIFQHMPGPVVIDNTTGLVDAYNFDIDHVFIVPTWQIGGHVEHAVGTSFNLWEGNQTVGFEADDVHGTHNQGTLFRNWINGLDVGKTQETVPIVLQAFSREYNIIGNVLGTPGYHTNYEDRYDLGTTINSDHTIYVLGYCANVERLSTGNCTNALTGAVEYNDAFTPTTLFRWGNYDTATGTVRWDASEVPTTATPYVNGNPVPASRTLPASFYLTSKPAWWGSMPWPAIGPGVTGGPGPGGFAYAIPAAVCYTTTPKDDNGILQFDANACYRSGPVQGGVLVQDSSGSAVPVVDQTSVTVTVMLSPVRAGNTLIAAMADTDASTTFAISGGGVTWTKAVQLDDPAVGSVAIYYGLNASGGSTSVSVTAATSGSPSSPNWPVLVEVTEWSGLSGLDVAATGSNTVGASPQTVSSGTAATTNPNDIVVVVGVLSHDNIGAITDGAPSGGFTALSGASATNRASLLSAYRAVSTTGNYSTAWTESWDGGGAGYLQGCVASFNEVAPLLRRMNP